jgi:pyruvate,water dikinase
MMDINGARATRAELDDFIVDLAGAGARPEVLVLGGKGARLAEMMNAGLAVPAGFCITAHAFREVQRASSVHDAIAGGDFAAIRAQIAATPFPVHLAQDILAAYERLGRPRVAVRSSGIAEDSAAQSFAGQHDTVLDVHGDEAVLAAVKHCWASLWSERVRSYGREGEAAMAVVVQTMVDADVAGVMFTVDPIEGRDRILIEACLGLGEGLVSSRVPSDSFVLEPKTLQFLDRQVRYKLTRCAVVAPGSIATVTVRPERREAPALTDVQARDLARLGLRLKEMYGADQDVEWAIRNDTIYLLQTRPVTTTAARPELTPYFIEQPPEIVDNTLWTRMDTGELFTGIMSPLGFSLVKHYLYNAHDDSARAVGLLDRGNVEPSMGFLGGHLYMNVSYTSHYLEQLPPTRDPSVFTNRFTSEEVDLASYENPFGHYPGGLRYAVTTANWLGYTAKELATMKRRCERMDRSRFEQFDRFSTIRLPALSRAQLSDELDRALSYFHDMHVGYLPFYMNAFGAYGVLTKLCAKWLENRGSNLQNRLKADVSNLRTVESAREVWRLAHKARDSKHVTDLITRTPLDEVVEALKADDEGRRYWVKAIEPFMRQNGVRGRQEFELTNPRWIDDPTYVFQMVRKYIDENFSIDDALDRGRQVRGGETLEILDGLPIWKRELLKLLIHQYSSCSEMRETARMAFITSVWLVRKIVYELARRLVAEGVLRTIDETAYLDLAEIRSYLAGKQSLEQSFSRTKLNEARKLYQYHLRLPEPPLSFVGAYKPTRRVEVVPTGDAIRGLGTSPGKVIGRARMIHDLARQANEFKAGEVLVTSWTDASWTPLFAIASAVVTDVGSVLSHSSIVAREFNIPSVVNTKRATRTVKTGDLLVVDGDAGTVHIKETS